MVVRSRARRAAEAEVDPPGVQRRRACRTARRSPAARGWAASPHPPRGGCVRCARQHARSARSSPTTRWSACCGARRTRRAGTPAVSANRASATLAAKLSPGVCPRRTGREVEDRERDAACGVLPVGVSPRQPRPGRPAFREEPRLSTGCNAACRQRSSAASGSGRTHGRLAADAGAGTREAGLRRDLDRRLARRRSGDRHRVARRHRLHRGGDRHRQHVDRRRRCDRGRVPTDRGSVPGPFPARRRHRAPGGDRASTAARTRRWSTTSTSSTPNSVPADQRALAALGPKALRLAADRTARCASLPDHSRAHPPGARDPRRRSAARARTEDRRHPDPETARALGRRTVADPYLKLQNYVASLRRLGFTDADFADGGSDALIDALVGHGDAAYRGAPSARAPRRRRRPRRRSRCWRAAPTTPSAATPSSPMPLNCARDSRSARSECAAAARRRRRV